MSALVVLLLVLGTMLVLSDSAKPVIACTGAHQVEHPIDPSKGNQAMTNSANPSQSAQQTSAEQQQLAEAERVQAIARVQAEQRQQEAAETQRMHERVLALEQERQKIAKAKQEEDLRVALAQLEAQDAQRRAEQQALEEAQERAAAAAVLAAQESEQLRLQEVARAKELERQREAESTLSASASEQAPEDGTASSVSGVHHHHHEQPASEQAATQSESVPPQPAGTDTVTVTIPDEAHEHTLDEDEEDDTQPLASLALSPVPAAQQPELSARAQLLLVDAAARLKSGDGAAAVELYRQAANTGTRHAWTEMGKIMLFAQGGVALNFTQALEYFTIAAEVGDPEAQYFLGLQQALGLGAPHDEAKALLNLYFSSMGNFQRAKMSLGFRHEFGYGVPKSCESAVLYYTPVAEEVVRELTEKPVALVIERTKLSDERTRNQSPEEDPDVIQYYQHSAEMGDVEAQVTLGHLHFYGARGVQQDHARAARYFQAAAAQGNALAMSSLGQMHLQGVGVTPSNATALELFEKAADKDDAQANNGLGFMYLHGHGVEKDEKLALKHFKKAAEKGFAEAQFNLGAMYFAGMGVPKKEYGTALQYFTLAGHQSHTRALYNLAQMHINGLGTIRNCPMGLKLLKTVSERGSWAGTLGDAHRKYLKGEFETAAMLYAAAAEEGFELGQANAAWMLTTQNLRMNASDKYRLAFRYNSFSADQGSVDAHRMLGDHYYYGWGRPVDYTQAVRQYQLAADAVPPNGPNAQSMFNLGYMHEWGLGVKQDYHLAKRWYDSALSTDPHDGMVPARLALLGLFVHEHAERLVAWWNGKVIDKPAATSLFGPSFPMSAGVPAVSGETTVIAGGEVVAKYSNDPHAQAQAPASSDSVHEHPGMRGEDDSEAEEEELTILGWSVEDILLLVLCGMLALVIYIRAA